MQVVFEQVIVNIFFKIWYMEHKSNLKYRYMGHEVIYFEY